MDGLGRGSDLPGHGGCKNLLTYVDIMVIFSGALPHRLGSADLVARRSRSILTSRKLRRLALWDWPYKRRTRPDWTEHVDIRIGEFSVYLYLVNIACIVVSRFRKEGASRRFERCVGASRRVCVCGDGDDVSLKGTGENVNLWNCH